MDVFFDIRIDRVSLQDLEKRVKSMKTQHFAPYTQCSAIPGHFSSLFMDSYGIC